MSINIVPQELNRENVNNANDGFGPKGAPYAWRDNVVPWLHRFLIPPFEAGGFGAVVDKGLRWLIALCINNATVSSKKGEALIV